MLKASKRPYMPSAITSSLITGFCLKKTSSFTVERVPYVYVSTNEDVFVKFTVQSAKRHPRVIDLNRGKTLAKAMSIV